MQPSSMTDGVVDIICEQEIAHTTDGVRETVSTTDQVRDDPAGDANGCHIQRISESLPTQDE